MGEGPHHTGQCLHYFKIEITLFCHNMITSLLKVFVVLILLKLTKKMSPVIKLIEDAGKHAVQVILFCVLTQ